MFGFSKRKKQPETGPVGGFAFFFSFLVVLGVGIFNIGVLAINYNSLSLYLGIFFIIDYLIGILLASFLIRGHLAVFLHEVRHKILSALVGNKTKAIHVSSESGHFEYSYTKETAHMNSLIALAPYWLPMFTIISIALGGIFLGKDQMITYKIIVGLAAGIDASLNFRDISPIQTDINQIRGGYRVGLGYIIAMNLFLYSYLIAWITGDLKALGILFGTLSHLFAALAERLREHLR
ncbi:MAG TPA: hypothetical protein PKD37_06405 [Oligoflexia bacterium]|nr:hypothetical protein [Oligoflexia bacterium]HMP27592.1 hypothetical protein [Oligoflexia bacterium]